MLKRLLPHIISVLVLLVLACVYFYPQIQGKQLSQSDITSYKGMSSEIREWQDKTGHKPLWTNVMFGGMPTYQISGNQPGNLARYIESAFQLFISRPIGYFFACSLCMYILLICLGCSPWVAVIGSIGYSYTTSLLTLYEAGHTSKMRVLSFIPLITAGVIMAYRKKFLLGGILFLIGSSVGLLANHPQMLYYMAFPLIFYVIVRAIDSVRENEILDFGKSSLSLVLGLIIAIGCSASMLFTTVEYAEDTMRGEPILEKRSDSETTSSNTQGLEWSYAMNWSQNMQDVTTLLVPGAAGGGSMEPAKWSDDLSGDRVWSRMLNQYGGKAPLYHGGLPFTSGPAYLGIVLVLFFILGYFVKGGKFYHWILLSIVFTVLLSMGKNMEWLNRFMFDYVPLFNKFRTPNSIMPITSFLLAMGGAVGLKDFLKSNLRSKKLQSKLIWSGAVAVGLCVLAWIMSSMYGFDASGDARFTQQGLSIDPLINARRALLSGDVFRNVILILLATGALWLILNKKLNKKLLLGGIVVLVLFDVWGVGKRYLNADTFKRSRVVENEVQPRQVDRKIMQDNDPHFRVYDLSINTFNSSNSSNFYKTIGGYHAAKLQRYQDLIDYHITKGNSQVLNMLNTKYIITQNKQLQRNPDAYGNAWFVNDLNFVSTNRSEINALNSTDLSNTAVIHEDFRDELQYSDYTTSGNINLTEYGPEKLTYSSQNEGPGFAVFSEIWYGPDKGWKAFVDGNEVPIVRVNYALRAIEIPAGNHEIVMKFHPETYYAGRTISYISSALLILSIMGLLYLLYRRESAEK